MSYHNLSECTLTNDERVAEKNRIVTNLENFYEQLSLTESKFLNDIAVKNTVSVKQLFWLRDINNKY